MDSADPTATAPRRALARLLPWVGGAAMLVVVAVLLQRWLEAGDSTSRRPVPQVTQIKLLEPPPPPPPPPPAPRAPETPTPAPREVPRMREVTPDTRPVATKPQPQAEREPTSAPPALDAAGTAGSDGFGLAGKPGGSDWIGGADPPGAGASGAAGGGSAEGFYAALMQSHVRGHLQRARSLTGARYRATVEVWLDPDGRASRVELVVGSGEPEVDLALRQALLGMPPMPRTPPEGLPQPVVLQVVSS